MIKYYILSKDCVYISREDETTKLKIVGIETMKKIIRDNPSIEFYQCQDAMEVSNGKQS